MPGTYSIKGSEGGNPSTLTPEITERLCAAVLTHPSKKLACQSCGVSYRTVLNWLRKSALGGASPLYTDFATRFGLAEAELARREFQDYQAATRDKGSREAGVILNFLKVRFPSMAAEAEVMDLLDTKERTADKRAALLNAPPPRMLAEMTKHGWMQFPPWMDEEDRAVLTAMQAKYALRAAQKADTACPPLLTP